MRDPASAAVDHRGVLAARENDAFALPDVERRETERIVPLESRNARGGKEQHKRSAYRRESAEAPGFPRAQPRGEKERVYKREPAEEERIPHINIRAREAREEGGHRVNIPHAPREDASGQCRRAGQKRAKQHDDISADVDRRNDPQTEDV